MNHIEPLSAMSPISSVASAVGTANNLLLGAPSPSGPSTHMHFGALLVSGVTQVEAKLNTADTLVRRFAIDDSVPVHQVTMALEEARLAVELAVQVRNKVVESYRELMNMQL